VKGRSARVRWSAVALVAALLIAAFVVSRVNKAQIDVSQDEAKALAREQVSFVPRKTAIKFVRQGVKERPHWAVSLTGPGTGDDRIVVTVLIDSQTGEVTEVTRARP
jgi:hypothetical protein